MTRRPRLAVKIVSKCLRQSSVVRIPSLKMADALLSNPSSYNIRGFTLQKKLDDNIYGII